MSKQLSLESTDIAFEALNLAMQINELENLRLMFSTFASLVSQSPGLDPKEYIRIMEKLAEKNGFLQSA